LNALADVKFAMGIFIKDKSKWDQYAGATSGYARSYINNDTYTIYEAATYLFTFGNDPKILPAITKLMEQVVTVNKTYDHYLLLAKIYYKMGQQDKAAAQADKAIASGIDKGVNTDDAEALLAEARKGK
jgi:tetratricopeptide (TPR) repeat protein